MAVLTWDQIGERFYETGVDHGVLYIPNGSGVYNDGVAWNGLTGVTESPTGAEATATYADNIKYLNLVAQEQFGGTIEAYTYPPEFGVFDGQVTPHPGLMLGQQVRKPFGLSYRTRIGNDLEGDDFGYKLHLVYGALAAPSERANKTVGETPEAMVLSWAFSTTPAPVTTYRPVSHIVIDSTEVSAPDLAALETILYGAVATEPALPTPDAVIALMAP